MKPAMNVKNRTLFIADNLDILRGINSDCIDLIYLDPPFNSKRQYRAPIGSPAEGATFKDIWTDADIKSEWHGEIAEHNEELYQIIQASEAVYDKSMKIYLMAMAVRLFEMQRILKPTGSIYLHCDPTASHYLKLVMDSIFGKKNFRNEIIWRKYGGRKNNAKSKFSTQNDILFFYAMSDKSSFQTLYEAHSKEEIAKKYKHIDDNGDRYRLAWGRQYQLTGQQRRIYLKDSPGRAIGNLWTEDGLQLNTSSSERTGWPTQKPLALLERIIKASSNEADVVLDPFCGCATACVAAEQLGRQWIGIDISDSAEVITKLRLQDEVDKQSALWNPLEDILVQTDAPVRTDRTETTPQRQHPKAHVHKHELYGKQEGKCIGCNHYFPFRNMTMDHIVPQSKGGTDAKANLQLLCNACNSTKSTRSQSEFIGILREQGIRTDRTPDTENRPESE